MSIWAEIKEFFTLKKQIEDEIKEIKNMEDSKKWYLSKGIWAGVVTILTGILAFVDQNFGTHITSSGYYATAVSLLGALGVYARASADTKIQ